jgi:rubredoxin
MVEVSVCTGCGMSQIARNMKTDEPACPICGGKGFENVTLPKALTCTSCKITKKIEDILKTYNKPPFYKHGTNGYYCGCRGWD